MHSTKKMTTYKASMNKQFKVQKDFASMLGGRLWSMRPSAQVGLRLNWQRHS